ncbi:MAG TPA: inositol monophosphatase family protein [Nocardioidaceae bacterium]|nr:inositol monophosphatase family protein [Nocardioidaceae bacterium]
MRSDHTDDLRLAHVLADDADSLTMQRFKALDLHVVTKPDLTPVSDADQSVEDGIRRTLSRARPRDAVVGEESGGSGWGPRRWVVDPIDGTKNYIRGVPVWATLIALMVEDVVVAGVVSAPALFRRWWAAKGGGAWTGRSLLAAQPCRVSDISTLADASLSYSSLGGWEGRGRGDDFTALTQRCWRSRAYGDFWSYMLVAEGAVDIALEPELALHDMAALSVIVQEAGGRFTGLDGTAGPLGSDALATNGKVHDQVLAFVGSLPASPDVSDDDDEDDESTGRVHDLSARRERGSLDSREARSSRNRGDDETGDAGD